KAATSCALAALSRVCPQGENLEVFLQVDPPHLRLGVRTTRPRLNYKDTGFRFQILQQLAHSLEGEVLLRIEPETELGLVLPYRDVAPEEVTIDSSDFVPSDTRRVLVVDNNPDGADTMAMWLEAHDDRVEVAYEG